jgi:hypothetical protein
LGSGFGQNSRDIGNSPDIKKERRANHALCVELELLAEDSLELTEIIWRQTKWRVNVQSQIKRRGGTELTKSFEI